MALRVFIREYWEPRKLCEKEETYWTSSAFGEGRVFVSLSPSFFRRKNYSMCGALRDAISHMVEEPIHRVKKGLSLVWTKHRKDILRFMKEDVLIAEARLDQGRALIRMVDWIYNQSIYTRRRLEYDPTQRRCFAGRRDGENADLLYSPRLYNHSYWDNINSEPGDACAIPRSRGQSERENWRRGDRS